MRFSQLILERVRRRFGESLLAVIVFGSNVYIGRDARDVNLLIILSEDMDFDEKLEKEAELKLELLREKLKGSLFATSTYLGLTS